MTRPRPLPELIRERRLAMGLSLGQLASRLGRTAASVRSWERGEEELDAELLGRLADVLELDPGDLAAAVPAGPEPEAATAPPPSDAEEEAEPVGVPEAEDVAGEADEGDDDPEAEVAEASPAEVEETSGEEEAVAVGAGAEEAEPDPFDTAEEGTGVEGRVVIPPMPENPTYEAEVVVVTEPRPLDVTVAAPVPAPVAPAGPDLIDAPTAAIPVEEMEREAKRARASAEPLPVGSVVVPHYLDDPRERRRYWIRTGLTAVVLFLLLVVVLWSAGHLGDALGEVLDQFGSSVP